LQDFSIFWCWSLLYRRLISLSLGIRCSIVIWVSLRIPIWVIVIIIGARERIKIRGIITSHLTIIYSILLDIRMGRINRLIRMTIHYLIRSARITHKPKSKWIGRNKRMTNQINILVAFFRNSIFRLSFYSLSYCLSFLGWLTDSCGTLSRFWTSLNIRCWEISAYLKFYLSRSALVN